MISGNMRDAVAGRLKASFEDLGGLELKNIDRPVRAFRVEWAKADWPGEGTSSSSTADASAAVAALASPPALPDKPSIAILPFTNMSADPEQEYFTDGITEDCAVVKASAAPWVMAILCAVHPAVVCKCVLRPAAAAAEAPEP